MKPIMVQSQFYANQAMKRLLLLSLLVVLPFSGFAQEGIMAMPYWMAKSSLNTSSLGEGLEAKELGITSFYKKQWSSIPNSPENMFFQLAFKANEKNSIGLQVMSLQFKTFDYQSIALPYVFNAKFNDQLSLQLGLNSKLLINAPDFTGLTPNTAIDVDLGQYGGAYFNATVSGQLSFKNVFSIGGSYNNFLTNNQFNPDKIINYSTLGANTWSAFTSMKLPLGSKLKMGIDGVYRSDYFFGEVAEGYLNFGTSRFKIGGGYRSLGDYVASVELFILPNLGFSYAYMNNTNAVIQQLGTSHCIGLKFNSHRSKDDSDEKAQ
jgi:hypothetical protein